MWSKNFAAVTARTHVTHLLSEAIVISEALSKKLITGKYKELE